MNHPSILAIYDVGTHGDAPYVVSELLEGETLRERLKSSTLPVRKSVDYAMQVARGLSAAHAKGIVHRDVKPENLFITKDGQIKIRDFGIAKLTSPLGEFGSEPESETMRLDSAVSAQIFEKDLIFNRASRRQRTIIITCRSRPPSNSQRKIPCHRPSSSFPSLKGTVTDEPTSVALM